MPIKEHPTVPPKAFPEAQPLEVTLSKSFLSGWVMTVSLLSNVIFCVTCLPTLLQGKCTGPNTPVWAVT